MKMTCPDCGRVFRRERQLASVFPHVPDLFARLKPGDTVPSGECPDCGSLVYIVTHDGPAASPTRLQCEGSDGVEEQHFLVQWCIDIHAGSFRAAAEKALAIHRDPESIATVFDVTCVGTGACERVDLQEGKGTAFGDNRERA